MPYLASLLTLAEALDTGTVVIKGAPLPLGISSLRALLQSTSWYEIIKLVIVSMSVAVLVASSCAEPEVSSFSTSSTAGGFGLSSPGIRGGFGTFGEGTRHGSFGGVGGGYGSGSGVTSHSIFNLGTPQGGYGGSFGHGGSSSLGFGSSSLRGYGVSSLGGFGGRSLGSGYDGSSLGGGFGGRSLGGFGDNLFGGRFGGGSTGSIGASGNGLPSWTAFEQPEVSNIPGTSTNSRRLEAKGNLRQLPHHHSIKQEEPHDYGSSYKHTEGYWMNGCRCCVPGISDLYKEILMYGFYNTTFVPSPLTQEEFLVTATVDIKGAPLLLEKLVIVSMSVAVLVACSCAEPDASSYSTYPYAGGSYGLSSPGIGGGFGSFGGGTRYGSFGGVGGGTRYGSFGGVGGGYDLGSGATSHSIFNLGAPQGRYGGSLGSGFNRGYIGGSSGLGFGGSSLDGTYGGNFQGGRLGGNSFGSGYGGSFLGSGYNGGSTGRVGRAAPDTDNSNNTYYLLEIRAKEMQTPVRRTKKKSSSKESPQSGHAAGAT
ncbi:uncharacterized protein [Procambarus clarkii]|uniref:uncharacterized protein n=1 Tax=Procambarus clarkii TaxID=6728 RepID=UPI003742A7C7